MLVNVVDWLLGSAKDRIGRRGKGREREKRVRVEFRVIVEDEVRADYRAAHTSFLLPPLFRLPQNYNGAREGREEAGAAAGRESKVKLHRQQVRGSAECLEFYRLRDG